MNQSASYTVIVDERDERIKLEGFGNTVGGCGLYLSNSRYSDSGKLTFAFNGTAVELHGVAGTTSAFGCTVDGAAIDTFTTPSLSRSQAANDRVLCGTSQLDVNKEHTLELTITSSPTINVDYLLYETSYTKLRNGDVLYYHSGRTDSFKYSSTGWSESPSTSTRFTQTELSSTNFTYYGSDSTLYLVGHESKGRGRGEIYIYSDTGDEVAGKIPLPSSSGNSDGCGFYRYYETAAMSTGNHSIMVLYRGGANQSDNIPLDISFFTVPVKNLVDPVEPPEQSSPSMPTESNMPIPPSKGLSPGAIAGIAVGVMVVLTILVLFFFWRRRRAHRTNAGWLHDTAVDPYIKPSQSAARFNYGEQGASGASSSRNLMSEEVAGVLTQTERSGKPVYHLSPPQIGTSHSRDVVQQEPERTELFIHSDSGVRMGNSSRSRLVEVPPMYTED